MAERFKAHAWKVCVPSQVPWVRIPLSPPFNVNKKLCSIKNETLRNKGHDILAKDLTHQHDDNLPGSNKFVLKYKKFHKSFRGNLKYIVFKINEYISKKYFK